MTLLEVLRRAAGYLDSHGSSSPRLDAELLLAHALGLRRLDLFLQFERPLSEAQLQPYRDLIGRRARGEPVAYLIGRKEFMGLEFEVTPDVLVPNPDTELLVQRAVAIGREAERPLSYADVGTGSGCIAVTVAHFLPSARVIASDLSPAALEVARRNCERHGVAGRVELREGDLLEPLLLLVDVICANLPYLRTGAELPAEVRAQPPQALFAGPAGAELVTRLLACAPTHLKPGGTVLAEMDPEISEEAVRAAAGYAGHRIHRDLGGHERLLEAWL